MNRKSMFQNVLLNNLFAKLMYGQALNADKTYPKK